ASSDGSATSRQPLRTTRRRSPPRRSPRPQRGRDSGGRPPDGRDRSGRARRGAPSRARCRREARRRSGSTPAAARTASHPMTGFPLPLRNALAELTLAAFADATAVAALEWLAWQTDPPPIAAADRLVAV